MNSYMTSDRCPPLSPTCFVCLLVEFIQHKLCSFLENVTCACDARSRQCLMVTEQSKNANRGHLAEVGENYNGPQHGQAQLLMNK